MRMTPEVKELIQTATSNLKILDIVLFESKFERPERDPAKLVVEAIQQQKREIQFFLPPDELAEGQERFLQVLVSLGVRSIASNAHENSVPMYVIEADFVVNYQVLGPIDAASVEAFANQNSVHNVWPFWRQHVFDTISRSRLPQIEIPLYAGITP
jgi:hypothetical protein